MDTQAPEVSMNVASPPVPMVPPTSTPSQKTHKPIWLKILIGFLVFILTLVIISGVIYFFFPQVGLSVLVHHQWPKQSNPLLYAIPEQHEIMASEIDTSTSPDFSYFGLVFKTPWPITDKKTGGDTIIALEAEDKKSSVILVKSGRKTLAPLLQGMNSAQASALFGAQAVQSERNMAQDIVNSSPDQIKFTSSPNQAAATLVLVGLKRASVLDIPDDKHPKIYTFSTDQIQGFQVFDSTNPVITDITFFDKRDQPFDLVIKSPNLTQADIDLILSSIKDI